MNCPKCKTTSGDDWSQCGGVCPMPGSPHYKAAKPSSGKVHFTHFDKETGELCQIRMDASSLQAYRIDFKDGRRLMVGYRVVDRGYIKLTKQPHSVKNL